MTVKTTKKIEVEIDNGAYNDLVEKCKKYNLPLNLVTGIIVKDNMDEYFSKYERYAKYGLFEEFAMLQDEPDEVESKEIFYYWDYDAENDIHELHYIDYYDDDYVVADLFSDVENYWECSLKERITESNEVKEDFLADSLEKAKEEVYQLVCDKIDDRLYDYFNGAKYLKRMLTDFVRFDESKEGGEKDE